METYFFVKVLSFLALNNQESPWKGYDHTQYLPMCGLSSVDSIKPTVANDQINRIPKGEDHESRLVILSYFSPKFSHGTGNEGDNGDGKGNENEGGNRDNGREESAHVNRTKNIKTTTTTTYNTPSAGQGIPAASMSKRSSLSSESKSQANNSCYCTIKSKCNFTIHIVDFRGSKPKESRLTIVPDHFINSSKSISHDIADFWTRNHSTEAVHWYSNNSIRQMTIKVTDKVTPQYPYMLLIAVAGTKDMKVQCKSAFIQRNNVRPQPKTNNFTGTPTQTTPPMSKQTRVTESTSATKGIFTPIFIAAIATFGASLVFFVIALVLCWKRSCCNSDKKGRRNKTTLSGERDTKNQQLYEEIMPDENISHSGSGTRLGNAVRKLSSPKLVGLERRKHSSEIKTMLSTNNNNNTNTNTTPNNNSVNYTHHDQTQNECSVYEELPEPRTTRVDTPPLKPFLDRKSLVISRSQSSPANNRCDVIDPTDNLDPDLERHRQVLKSSISYTDNRCLETNGGQYHILEDYRRQKRPAHPFPVASTDDEYEADCEDDASDGRCIDVSFGEGAQRSKSLFITATENSSTCFKDTTPGPGYQGTPNTSAGHGSAPNLTGHDPPNLPSNGSPKPPEHGPPTLAGHGGRPSLPGHGPARYVLDGDEEMVTFDNVIYNSIGLPGGPPSLPGHGPPSLPSNGSPKPPEHGPPTLAGHGGSRSLPGHGPARYVLDGDEEIVTFDNVIYNPCVY